MLELARRPGVVLVWLLVALGVVIGDVVQKCSFSLLDNISKKRNFSLFTNAPARQLRPKGAEWRSIWRLPAGRVCAVRLQVIVC